MKRLMIALSAVVAAVGLRAAAVTLPVGDSFNDTGTWPVGKITTLPGGWSEVGDSSVSDAPYSFDHAKTAAGLPNLWWDEAAGNNISLKTPLSMPMYYTIDGETGISMEEGVYFDSLVKFVACDEDTTPVADAKIMVWTKETTDSSGDVIGTNLMVTAGYFKDRAGGIDPKIYDCGPIARYGIVPTADAQNDWCRLTIKAIRDISDGDVAPGFVVFVNAHALEMVGSGSALDIGVEGSAASRLVPAAQIWKNGNSLFPSLVSRDTTIRAVGFAGQGGFDDLSLINEEPTDGNRKEFARDCAVFFLLRWTPEDVAALQCDGKAIDVSAGQWLLPVGEGGSRVHVTVSYAQGKMKGTWTHSEGVRFTDDDTGAYIDIPAAGGEGTIVARNIGAIFNGNSYATAAEAVAAANATKEPGTNTLTLLGAASDIVLQNANANVKLVIDLAGQTISAHENDYALVVKGGDVTIIDSTDAVGTVKAGGEGSVNVTGGTLLVTAGRYKGNVASDGATLTIEAGDRVSLSKLSGAGTVHVALGATFSCADLTGFTGRIVSYGTVNLTEEQWAACARGDFIYEYIPTAYLRNVSPDSVYCSSLPDDVRFYTTLFTTNWSSYGAKDAYRVDADGRRPFGYCSGSVTQAVGYVDVGLVRDEEAALMTWTMRPVRELPELNQFSVTLGLTVRDFAGGEGKVIVDGVTRALTEAVMSNKTFQKPKKVEVYDKTGRLCLVLEPQQDSTLLIQDNRSGGWGETFSLRFSVYAPTGWVIGNDYVQSFRMTIPGTHLELKPFGYKTLVAGDEWIPLATTYADSVPGSILDFSSFRKTPGDAGAYGRVVVRNGHFEFENLPGVPQRFFGANLTEDASCPDKTKVGRCCAQLARMGYNAVRIHHHEKRLVAGGSDLAATNLSATAIDKFDAFVAACLTNGLYLTTDLYVSRSPIYWRAVGYDRDGSLESDDFKYLVYADEKVFANLCDFTRNYFSHVNPYTGRSLAAEPALLGINLINEGNKSYFANPKNLLANYPAWKPKWEAWLTAKKKSEPSVYGTLSAEPPANLTSTAEGAAFAQFLRETEETFFDRLKALLRDELGCRAPLTNLNGGSDKTAAYFLPRAERYDYIDYHRYVDHPSFLETKWTLPSKTGNSNPLTDVRAGMPSFLDLRIPGKPFTLSEWNYSGPSLHRSMGGLFYGAIHALQDHDGIFRFAWSQGKGGVENPEGKSAGAYFDIVGDPLARASERIASLLFMRGDLKPLEKNYIYRYTRKVASAALADKPGGSGTSEERHWAGWYAKLGSVVGAAVPAGASEAGVWPNAAKTKAQIWADLGIVPPADGSLPPAGDGQVVVDRNIGSLAVSTPKTAAFFVPQGEGIAGSLVANVGEKSATVCAAAMDDEPLVRSARVLFFHLTEAGNTGEQFSDDTQQIVLKWGSRPSLMRAGKAEVELAFEDSRYRAVWVLDEGGTSLKEVPSWWQGTKLRFVADVAADPTRASYQYEIRVTRPLGTHVIIR